MLVIRGSLPALSSWSFWSWLSLEAIMAGVVNTETEVKGILTLSLGE